MGKIAQTWSLMGASWDILKEEKKLLILPLFSMISCLLVSVSFILPWFPDANLQPLANLQSLAFWEPWIEKLQSFGLAIGSGDHSFAASFNSNMPYYLGYCFLFYLANYFVIVFFNSAIVACVALRLEGGNPSVADGLRAAFGLLPFIAAWVLLSATVGQILRHIRDRSSLLGGLVAGFLGLAWTLASFLVIPVMVVEKVDPIEALKRSALLLKQTWGQDLISQFGFGLIFSLLSLPAYIFCIWGMNFADLGFLISGGLAAVYLIIVALVYSALQTTFLAALYFYARRGVVPAGFSKEMLANSIQGRRPL